MMLLICGANSTSATVMTSVITANITIAVPTVRPPFFLSPQPICWPSKIVVPMAKLLTRFVSVIMICEPAAAPQKWLDKTRAFQPGILSSHCFRRTINPPMNIHSILYAIFYVNLDLTQFSFKNVISSVCSCTLRISFIFIYTQHIFDIIRHLPRHLKLLRNTGMPRCSHTISAEQKI